MKKLFLAIAVAALSVSAAQAAPTVYGKAFLTLDYQDLDKGFYRSERGELSKSDKSDTKLNSNGSRIGFKGAEALTANTDLVYQLEYGVKVDDNSQQFKSRDTYLGLSNKQYGTALAGRLTAIDDMVNYANVTVGGVLGGDNVLASIDGPRANNAFAYVSPNYNGLNFLAMYALDSDHDATVGAKDDLGDLDNNEKWGVGAKYEPAGQPYRLGATYIGVGSDLVKDIRVSGAYDLNPQITVGGLYQNTDIKGAKEKENAFTLSGTYKTVTPWTAYAQADYVQNVLGKDGADRQRYVVGGKYAFNAATTGHVYGAFLNDAHAKGEGKDSKGYGIGTGIEYKF